MTVADGQVYEWNNVTPPQSHSYLRARLDAIIAGRQWPPGARALDFGCGNGSLSAALKRKGFAPVGVDISVSGVAVARQAFPDIVFSNDLSAENIARLGPYDVALCIEVIAHCFDPAAELKKIFDSLKPGGVLVLATPYYGYLKILVLALLGKLTAHHSVASKANYVSMFTPGLITELLRDAGFTDIDIGRVGRIPALAKDMVVVARKP
ncbi:MAG TPA: class I SAM-dependent methyltransferase [Pseudolabrys sp.]|nr:class I SAM-dependent methyltransferase [Pseudolabrys sp.]